MRLVLTNQFANILLLLNGLAVLLYIGAKKKNRQRAMRFGNYETLQKVAGKNFLSSGKIMLVLRLLALTLLIVGISSPAIVNEVSAASSDFVIAIDSSSSMLSGDIDPNRFQASKEISSNFISSLGNGTQAGAITFSGSVTNEHSRSSDTTAVAESIDSASVGTEAGTAIGEAISVSVSMLSGIEGNRTVVLITDGRNNVGTSINDSLNIALEQGVEIHTVGIGDSNRTVDKFGSVDGRNVSRANFPNLDSDQLERIANVTGGSYNTVSNRSGLEEAIVQVEQTEDQTNISNYFIFSAAVILLLEWVLGNTRYSIIP